ncbi:putative uncharacterized protein DDB_G0282133 [Ctenocephalides felis]|uniref:putative uncharacterized protein DDB_G0282133 n=1 Tax=Ctenocephalides felis TaxID=7515 RepID=UPI000E6E5594|nr:putative uncharacterized protein DDB_G0282133 [Ctenocephalides felis]
MSITNARKSDSTSPGYERNGNEDEKNIQILNFETENKEKKTLVLRNGDIIRMCVHLQEKLERIRENKRDIWSPSPIYQLSGEELIRLLSDKEIRFTGTQSLFKDNQLASDVIGKTRVHAIKISSNCMNSEVFLKRSLEDSKPEINHALIMKVLQHSDKPDEKMVCVPPALVCRPQPRRHPAKQMIMPEVNHFIPDTGHSSHETHNPETFQINQNNASSSNQQQNSFRHGFSINSSNNVNSQSQTMKIHDRPIDSTNIDSAHVQQTMTPEAHEQKYVIPNNRENINDHQYKAKSLQENEIDVKNPCIQNNTFVPYQLIVNRISQPQTTNLDKKEFLQLCADYNLQDIGYSGNPHSQNFIEEDIKDLINSGNFMEDDIKDSANIGNTADVVNQKGEKSSGETKPGESSQRKSSTGGSSPEGSSPQGSIPEGSSPKGSSPKGSNPEGSNPEGSNPEGSNSEGSMPGKSISGELSRRKSSPEKLRPEKSSPEKLSPENSSSEKLSPETLSPRKSSLEKSSPEKSNPEKSNPEKSNPEKSSPEKSSLRKSSPGESNPEKSSPEKSSPGKSNPEKSSPEKSSSGESSPEKSSPGKSGPGESSPGESSLEKSSPGESSPGESSPGEWSPGKSRPEKSSPGESSPGKSSPGKSSLGEIERIQLEQDKSSINSKSNNVNQTSSTQTTSSEPADLSDFLPELKSDEKHRVKELILDENVFKIQANGIFFSNSDKSNRHNKYETVNGSGSEAKFVSQSEEEYECGDRGNLAFTLINNKATYFDLNKYTWRLKNSEQNLNQQHAQIEEINHVTQLSDDNALHTKPETMSNNDLKKKKLYKQIRQNTNKAENISDENNKGNSESEKSEDDAHVQQHSTADSDDKYINMNFDKVVDENKQNKSCSEQPNQKSEEREKDEARLSKCTQGNKREYAKIRNVAKDVYKFGDDKKNVINRNDNEDEGGGRTLSEPESKKLRYNMYDNKVNMERIMQVRADSDEHQNITNSNTDKAMKNKNKQTDADADNKDTDDEQLERRSNDDVVSNNDEDNNSDYIESDNEHNKKKILSVAFCKTKTQVRQINNCQTNQVNNSERKKYDNSNPNSDAESVYSNTKDIIRSNGEHSRTVISSAERNLSHIVNSSSGAQTSGRSWKRSESPIYINEDAIETSEHIDEMAESDKISRSVENLNRKAEQMMMKAEKMITDAHEDKR